MEQGWQTWHHTGHNSTYFVLNINILHGYNTKSHYKHILKKSYTLGTTPG